MHIHDVCVYWFLVATVTTSHSGCRCILQRCLLPLKCIKLFVYFEGLMRLVVLVFRMFLWPLWGNITLLPRLLVVVRLLQLVILVFEECSALHGEMLLFIVGCLLLCDRYVWSYWFLIRLALTAVVSPIWSHACCFLRSVRLVAMVSLAVSYNARDILLKERKKKILYFPTVWWSLFCLVFCVFVAEKRIVLSWIILRQDCKNLVDWCARETLRFNCLFSTALSWKRVWRPWALDGGSGAIKPVLWPYVWQYHAQNVIFFFHLHVLNVGRDTELYSGVSLNYECGRWVWPCFRK